MDIIITKAQAQTVATGSGGGFDFMSLLPLVLIFVVFYFFLIRPQQKKAQQHRELLTALSRGDRIVTNGGLIGIVTKVINDQELQIEIAEGVRVRVARAMVANLLSKTEPNSDSFEETNSPDPKTNKSNRAAFKSSSRNKKK